MASLLPRECGARNSFHLVSLSSTGTGLRLDTHQTPLSIAAKRVKFDAFSHVRLDGLESSTTNSLPSCQIAFLQKLSNELLPKVEQLVPFYIDTLCVSLAGRAKRHALRSMRAFFELVNKVLVLDSDLQRTPAGLPQENLTRMHISVWMKRLWIVQECAVSNDVYFRSKGQHLSLNGLLDTYDTGDEFPILRTQNDEIASISFVQVILLTALLVVLQSHRTATALSPHRPCDRPRTFLAALFHLTMLLMNETPSLRLLSFSI
jgi:hypothetical protein